jgi:hypothetical protein
MTNNQMPYSHELELALKSTPIIPDAHSETFNRAFELGKEVGRAEQRYESVMRQADKILNKFSSEGGEVSFI